MTVRLATKLDVPKIHQLSLDTDWPCNQRDVLRRVRELPYSFAVFEDRSLKGYVDFYLNGELFFLNYLVSDKQHRNKGIGSKLLEHVVNQAPVMGAKGILLFSKPECVGFYEKHGFRNVYGITPRDAFSSVRMELIIPQKP